MHMHRWCVCTCAYTNRPAEVHVQKSKDAATLSFRGEAWPHSVLLQHRVWAFAIIVVIIVIVSIMLLILLSCSRTEAAQLAVLG